MKKPTKSNTNADQTKEPQKRSAQPSSTTESPIDFTRRNANRALDSESLLALLRKDAPQFFELAEVVGKWVWIHFPEKQPADVTKALSEFGFHWNNRRQSWQHPGGTIPQERRDYDPRKRYRSYYAADEQAA